MTTDNAPITLLLVDDELVIRELGRRFLERLGYEVLVAENGQVAVDIYRERGDQISLVILDLVMPVMDGSQAFTELMRLDPNVTILICSGELIKELCKDLLDLGAAGLVDKPFDLETLPAAVKRALSR